MVLHSVVARINLFSGEGDQEKFSLCTSWRHMGEWKYSSTHP